MIVKNEEKRTKAWSIVTLVSTLVVIALAVFLVVKLFTTNPLTGTWESDDGDMVLKITGSAARATIIESDAKAEYNYTVDRSDKLVSFSLKGAEVDDGTLQAISSSFDYSIDGDTMTLTEREYGEQYIFYKQ